MCYVELYVSLVTVTVLPYIIYTVELYASLVTVTVHRIL